MLASEMTAPLRTEGSPMVRELVIANGSEMRHRLPDPISAGDHLAPWTVIFSLRDAEHRGE